MLAEHALGQALRHELLPAIGPGWVKVCAVYNLTLISWPTEVTSRLSAHASIAMLADMP
jgi:hypothetical protein